MSDSHLLSIHLDLFHWLTHRRRVRVTVHRAFLAGDPKEKAFITVTNLSERDVEIVRIWLDAHPPLEVLNAQRALPRRLKPDETWATWFELDTIDPLQIGVVETLARVRISTGKTFKSIAARDVGPVGSVPG